MDYLTQPRRYQVKKVLRYTRLYGPRRTLSKIQAELHMGSSRTFSVPLRRGGPSANVGLIGCGRFAFSNIAYYLRKNHGPVIRGTMDRNASRAASLAKAYGATYSTDDATRIITDDKISLVYVASNHASHTPYAIQAIDAGKAVHIEKPHVVSDAQLADLHECMKRNPAARVALGFNRPHSPANQAVLSAASGEEGPCILQWFIAGHDIPPDHWYYAEEEGGRVLGNLCHWTDHLYRTLSAFGRRPLPATIHPIRTGNSQENFVVNMKFGDGSLGSIAFSAQGHVFDGVRERFTLHRGNTFATIDDFQRVVVDKGTQKKVLRSRYRNHGHEARVLLSYGMVGVDSGLNTGAESVEHLIETAELFLRTREALESDTITTALPYREWLERLGQRASMASGELAGG